MASLTLAVRLELDQRSTAAYTQVMLQTSRDAIADAQRELAVAPEADHERWAVATPIVSRAASEVSVLARTGASRLTVDDLTRLSDCDDDVVICCASVDAKLLTSSCPNWDFTNMRRRVFPSHRVDVATS